MNQRRSLCLFFCLTLVALGCGDSPHKVMRDTVTTWNELADLLVQIPDDPETADDYAQVLLKGKMDELKKKWEIVNKRTEQFGKYGKEEKKELENAIEDLKSEAKYSLARLAGEAGGTVEIRSDVPEPIQSRLKNMLAKFKKQKPAGTWPNVEACIALVGDFHRDLPNPREYKNSEKYKSWWRYPTGKAGGGGGMGTPGGMGIPGMQK